MKYDLKDSLSFKMLLINNRVITYIKGMQKANYATIKTMHHSFIQDNDITSTLYSLYSLDLIIGNGMGRKSL